MSSIDFKIIIIIIILSSLFKTIFEEKGKID